MIKLDERNIYNLFFIRIQINRMFPKNLIGVESVYTITNTYTIILHQGAPKLTQFLHSVYSLNNDAYEPEILTDLPFPD